VQSKPWFSYNDYLQKRFGEKVSKVTVSAGFTCPTRDGKRGSDGCAFCDEHGSGSFFSAGQGTAAIRDQIVQAIPAIRQRFNANKFLAYFQSFTNTYAPVKYLQEVYDGAIGIPDVVGMAVGTRPDCIAEPVLNLLDRYAVGGQYVSLELGLQSLRDDALNFYTRGHTAEEGVDGIRRALKHKNLAVCVHLMFGAPGDNLQTAIDAAQTMNDLGVHGVKLHQLMILKNTGLATRYAREPWPLFTLEQYNELACAFLENLDPNIYVERTHALATHPEDLVAPDWASKRWEPFNDLVRRLTKAAETRPSQFGSRDLSRIQ